MVKPRRLTAFFVMIVILAAVRAFAFAPRPAGAQDRAAEMLQLVNNFRIDLGLRPFQFNASLAAAAQQQAAYIANNNLYTHTGPGGSSPQDRARSQGYNGFVVENIVGGTRMTTQQGLTWWINSPVHYNTLVSTRHTEAGTGYAFGNEQHRYALVVGRPADRNVSSTSSAAEPQPAPLIIEPVVLAEPREDGSIIHVVGQGQALWSLAAYYEVPLSTLLLYNNLEEDSFLQPGDEILIRLAAGQAPPPTPTPPATHIVKKGQTLWTIAAIYDLRLSDLLWYNGLREGGYIQPGQELIIRLREGENPPPTPTPQRTVRVEDGDSLWSIAARHGLTLEQLLAYNGLGADALIRPGQELVIRPEEATPFPPTFTPLPPATAFPIGGTEAASMATPVEGAMRVGEAVVVPGETVTPSPEPASASETAGPDEGGLFLLGAGALVLGLLGSGLIVLSRRRPG